MDIIVWEGECSRCYNPKLDELSLYLSVGPSGVRNAQMICKNAMTCQERQRSQPNHSIGGS